MSNIPLARQRLDEMRVRFLGEGRDEDAAEIEGIIQNLHRVKYRSRRAPHQSQTVTGRLSLEIAEFAKANPQMTTAKIAERFNVNPGRVSEAIASH